jgi:hypothetical protein
MQLTLDIRGDCLAGTVESLQRKHLIEVHRIPFEGTRDERLGGIEERARLAVRRLEEAGVLRQTSAGRRNRAWECIGS